MWSKAISLAKLLRNSNASKSTHSYLSISVRTSLHHHACFGFSFAKSYYSDSSKQNSYGSMNDEFGSNLQTINWSKEQLEPFKKVF